MRKMEDDAWKWQKCLGDSSSEESLVSVSTLSASANWSTIDFISRALQEIQQARKSNSSASSISCRSELSTHRSPRHLRQYPNKYQYRLGCERLLTAIRRSPCVLYVANLNQHLSKHGIKRKFCIYGDIKRVRIYYDKRGTSTGTADVVFSQRQYATAALKDIERFMYVKKHGMLRAKLLQ